MAWSYRATGLWALGILLIAGFGAGCMDSSVPADSARAAEPEKDPNWREPMEGEQVAVFGGGCFWCIEAAFDRLKGVREAESGYAGGAVANPTYEAVCSGATGHAEVVRILYDPKAISYHDLLDVFFTIHDPTTLNRQGADVGTQYRSVIFYQNDEQKAAAEEAIEKASEKWGKKAVTQLVPAAPYYPAEKYHQEYYENNRQAGYCRVVIDPKLKKLEKEHAEKLE